MKKLSPQSLALIAFMLAASSLWATVDEAHDYTMEAAAPYVQQGYTVREDYWNGEVASGQKLAIHHQLFKGNEYAFWLGTANENCELEIAIYDDKNQPVHMETKSDKFTCSVRVNPPKTGTYTVVFSVKSKKEKGVTWALAYGYR
ncbi:MAG: hypothetical protein RL693_1102 [Verrucomicrobiota bacterium]|jgi:hypothetical protein